MGVNKQNPYQIMRRACVVLGTNPGDLKQLSRPFGPAKFAAWAFGGWGLKDWLLPSVFIGRGDGPDFDRIVQNSLRSSSAITKTNWFDSHFSTYTEWFAEHFPGFFDSRYRFEMGAKTILSSKYPVKEFPVVDQRTWRCARLNELFEIPVPEHTFQFGGPVLLNLEARRAEKQEQEYHGKDFKWIDSQPLHVASESHNEVATIGDYKVYNGIWTGNKDGWMRDTVKPELTAAFHSPVWYRNVFISKNPDQPEDHFGENVSEETQAECKEEYLKFTKRFHEPYSFS
eukprot:NODE_3689_length_933_cov_336.877828_g3390_i0.p1 GENE.NODE_3689_length_933_cov_336.877828_g3390_i0~~NODE_3689_length_933_cov_336.877828_g3390_i0.p1  ORF type:complete len:285 (-),score=30.34 NODE_3689_length_933_cov_336.877828_g3390_i0:52-906(-)